MTTPRRLFDTDVLVDYLRGRHEAVDCLESCEGPMAISAISVAELYVGARDPQERGVLAGFLSVFEVIPVDRAIAERGGLLRREFGPSHGTGLADALIAATAELSRATLVTLNRKHFPMVVHLDSPYCR